MVDKQILHPLNIRPYKLELLWEIIPSRFDWSTVA